MSQLKPARITPLDDKGKETSKGAFDVQFNPASLRMQTSVQPPAGGGQSSVPRQAATSAKTTLTMELHFDTYDEGSSDDPVPVTRKTAMLEQFLRPMRETADAKPVPPPPRIKFAWGGFELTGIVSQLSVEYDHFHHQGAPLRAKCGVTLETQDPLLAAPPATSGPASGAGQPGVNGSGVNPAPGNLAGPGQVPVADRGALAQAGESLAAFAHRNGIDPRDWRDLAQGIADIASLPAGLEITYSTRSPDARQGGAGSGGDPARAAQIAVTAAGGPAAAAAARREAGTEAAIRRERAAFGAPPQPQPQSGPASASPGRNTPTGSGANSGTQASRPFGAGIPLRPRLGGARPETRSAAWTRGGGNRGPGCGCE